MSFIMENDIDNAIASLGQVSDALFNWFKNNRLKNNADNEQTNRYLNWKQNDKQQLV